MSKTPAWAKGYEDEARFDNLRPLMLRKRVRYQLSRLRTEAAGGAKADPPKGFKKFFSDQEFFDEWENWGVTWDVGTPMIGTEFDNLDAGSDDPLEVVARFESIEERHQSRMDAEMRTNELQTRRNKRAQQMDAASGNEDNG